MTSDYVVEEKYWIYTFEEQSSYLFLLRISLIFIMLSTHFKIQIYFNVSTISLQNCWITLKSKQNGNCKLLKMVQNIFRITERKYFLKNYLKNPKTNVARIVQ